MIDFLLMYHFRKLKGVAIEILQELVDNITTNTDTDTDTFISEHGENPVNTNKHPEALKVSNTIG